MGWFNRKPRDLIADCLDEVERERPQFVAIPTHAPSISGFALTDQEFQDAVTSTRDFGGWCAPSETVYDFFQLPEIQIKRGGVKWPTN